MSVGAVLAGSSWALATPAGAAGSDAGGYLTRLNAERASHGLPGLTPAGDLTAVAQGWAEHMSAALTLQHNPNLTTAVADWRAVGENVGEGPTISDIDRAFWASAEHRANILDGSYTQVGVGVVRSSGLVWIAVDFRDPLSAPVTGGQSGGGTGGQTAGVTAGPLSIQSGLLQLGSVGARVSRLQRMLRVPADGVFGPRTRHAVTAFQRRHHLRVDGVAGPRTRSVLHAVVRRRAARSRADRILVRRWLAMLVRPLAALTATSQGEGGRSYPY